MFVRKREPGSSSAAASHNLKAIEVSWANHLSKHVPADDLQDKYHRNSFPHRNSTIVIFNVFTGSEAACASRDEIMGMGTVLSRNGGGFLLFLFSFPTAEPTKKFQHLWWNLWHWSCWSNGISFHEKGKIKSEEKDILELSTEAAFDNIDAKVKMLNAYIHIYTPVTFLQSHPRIQTIFMGDTIFSQAPPLGLGAGCVQI